MELIAYNRRWQDIDKCNKDLSNLTETGEKHFLNKAQITNCLLEVPERIKLDLNNGTLTLRADSQAILPNGFTTDGVTANFDYISIENDISYEFLSSQNGVYDLFVDEEGKLGWSRQNLNASGNLTEELTINSMYYRTDLNQVYYKNINTNKYSFPIGYCTLTDGIPSNVHVCKGFGFIGGTVFADKGIKGLIPNGRNSDNTLKNNEFETKDVLICSITSGYSRRQGIALYPNLLTWRLYTELEQVPRYTARWYNQKTNYMYKNDPTDFNLVSIDNCCYVGDVGYTDGKIDYIEVNKPFKAVDNNELSRLKVLCDRKENQVTNAILEVPQDIIYSITDGVLTLKKGSKIYVPNGFIYANRSFKELILDEDKTLAYAGAREDLMVCITSSGQFISAAMEYTVSDETEPTVTENRVIWFDAANNVIKTKISTESSWQTDISFPVFRVSINDSSKVSKIKNVFNGFGFIGHHTFSYPGIVCTLADGRNPDGTFDNDLRTSRFVNVRDESGRSSWICFWDGTNILTYGVKNYFEQNIVPTVTGQYNTWLNTLENQLYVTSDYGTTWTKSWRCLIGNLRKEPSGNITEFELFSTFKSVGFDQFKREIDALKETVSSASVSYCTTVPTTTSTASSTKPAVIVENYVNGTSWYRVWSDGWIEQGGYISSIANGGTITFLKPFTNTNYIPIVVKRSTSNTGNNGSRPVVSCNASSKDSMTVYNIWTSNDGTYNISIYWEAKGY